MNKISISKERCSWPGEDPLYLDYHDHEWGVPVYDDNKIFEFLILESMQAGLSWILILHKRENFRKAFAGFNPQKVARFNEKKVESLLQNPGIIRNRLKVKAAISNAQAFLTVQNEFDTFSKYIWNFTDGKPIVNNLKTHKAMPAETPLSNQISKDLRQRGFKFVGPTVIYSHMQAAGMVNDHLVTCFRHKEVETFQRNVSTGEIASF